MSLTSGTTGRIGCGQSLALGYAYGLIGAVLAILVAAGSSFVLLLLAGSVVLGEGNAAAFLTRYEACSHLFEMEYKKRREAFCDSIMGTINHPMVGDRIWSVEQTYAFCFRCLSQSDESLMSTVGTEPDGTYWHSVDINPLTYAANPHTQGLLQMTEKSWCPRFEPGSRHSKSGRFAGKTETKSGLRLIRPPRRHHNQLRGRGR